jgi:hypothetical protein
MEEYKTLVDLVNLIGTDKACRVHNFFMRDFYVKHGEALLKSKNSSDWFNYRSEVFERYVRKYYNETKCKLHYR